MHSFVTEEWYDWALCLSFYFANCVRVTGKVQAKTPPTAKPRSMNPTISRVQSNLLDPSSRDIPADDSLLEVEIPRRMLIKSEEREQEYGHAFRALM